MKKKKIIEIVVITLLIIVITTISIGVITKREFLIDKYSYSLILEHRNFFLNNFFRFITIFGEYFIFIIITIICFMFLKNKNYKILVTINLLIIFLGNTMLKYTFLRERPNNLRLIDIGGYSYPSGHAMVSTAFYGLIIYLIYINDKNIKRRNILCIFLILLIFLISVSRVYLGVHYVTDVVAGISISIIYLLIFLKICKNRKKI